MTKALVNRPLWPAIRDSEYHLRILHLWGNSLWAEGYFPESVGQVTEARIKQYIKSQ